VEEWHWDVPLRLLAALHALVLDGRASWDDVGAALEEHEEGLRRAIVERPVQTNEVQRSWALLPCFLLVAARTGADVFDVVDLGASAGLNLFWDQYRHVYERGSWGPELARLELSGEERGQVPAALLSLRPRVRDRVGIDRSPIDLSSEEGRRLLRSFVWADQAWRLEQLERAVDAWRDDPPELEQGDVADLLPEVLGARGDGALTIVVNTAALIYLPEERRRLVFGALEAAGRERPLAYVGAGSGEDHHALVVRLWPGGGREVVARADYHGAWLDWSGSAE
jgi:hypothetical protein